MLAVTPPRAAATTILHDFERRARAGSATSDDLLMTINLIHRNERLPLGESDADLNRALRRGELIRVAPGTYAAAHDWDGLEPMERHRTRVLAAVERTTDVVFSHHAAAALWGIRLLGEWPTTVDVTVDRATGGRSSGQIRRHCVGLDRVAVTMLDGILVTTPAQTVIDLARALPFAQGVAAIDSALHRKRRPVPLADREELLDLVAATQGRRLARLRAAADFSTDLSDSVEESHSRVQLHLLGFPRPELQVVFALPDGSRAEPDFYGPDYDHVGECDGRDKYRNPQYLKGRSPEEVVIHEKNRENELRRVVSRLSRWEPADLYPPRKLYDRLTRDGLPSTLPRP